MFNELVLSVISLFAIFALVRSISKIKPWGILLLVQVSSFMVFAVSYGGEALATIVALVGSFSGVSS